MSAEALTDADGDIDVIRLATLLDGKKYLNEMKSHYMEITFSGATSFLQENAIKIKEFLSLPEGLQEDLLKNASKRWKEKYMAEVSTHLQRESVMITLYKPYINANSSTEEVKQLIQFYRTELGKKTLQLQNDILRECRYRFSEELVPVMTTILEKLAESELALLKHDIDIAVKKP